MKLIIDIPKGTYEAVKVGTINQVLEYKVWNAIKNGTPFDSVIEDIKAEIDEQYDRVRPYNIDVAQGLEMALDILDRIGKADMRDKI